MNLHPDLMRGDVRLDQLPAAQRRAIEGVQHNLHNEYARGHYPLYWVPRWLEDPEGTVRFKDGIGRVWCVRPDGTYRWFTQ